MEHYKDVSFDNRAWKSSLKSDSRKQGQLKNDNLQNSGCLKLNKPDWNES